MNRSALRRTERPDYDEKAKAKIVELYRDHDLSVKVIAERFGRRDTKGIIRILDEAGVRA